MHLEERIIIFYKTRTDVWGSFLRTDVREACDCPFEHLLTANAMCKGLGKLVTVLTHSTWQLVNCWLTFLAVGRFILKSKEGFGAGFFACFH